MTTADIDLAIVRVLPPDRPATVPAMAPVRVRWMTVEAAARDGLVLQPGEAAWIGPTGESDSRPAFPIDRTIRVDLTGVVAIAEPRENERDRFHPESYLPHPGQTLQPDQALLRLLVPAMLETPEDRLLRAIFGEASDGKSITRAVNAPLPWLVELRQLQAMDASGKEIRKPAQVASYARSVLAVVGTEARPDIGDRVVVDGETAMLVTIRDEAGSIDGPCLVIAAASDRDARDDTVQLLEPLARDRAIVHPLERVPADPRRGEALPQDALTFLANHAQPALACALGSASDNPVSGGGTNWRRLRTDVALAGIGWRIDDDGALAPVSDEDVLARSTGRVRKPETLNRRTARSERQGLLCEQIFGSVNDLCCYCGKYAGDEHRGTVCDRCGVEVTPATDAVRWRRSGHIELPTEVIPYWWLHGDPCPLSALTGLSTAELWSVVRWERHIEPVGPAANGCWRLADPDPLTFAQEVSGPRAVRQMLEGGVPEAWPDPFRQSVLEAWRAGRLTIESVLRRTIAVPPPGFRPLELTPNGDSDEGVNDLLRRLVNRANRLERLIELNAPVIILMNEERMMLEVLHQVEANAICPNPWTRGSQPVASVGRLAMLALDPPADDARVLGSGRLVVRVNPALGGFAVRLPAGAVDAGDLLLWSSSALAVVRHEAAVEVEHPLAELSPVAASAMQVGTGDLLSFFCPRDLSAREALAAATGMTAPVRAAAAAHARDEPESNRMQAMFDAMIPHVVNGERLPLTDFDRWMRLGPAGG